LRLVTQIIVNKIGGTPYGELIFIEHDE